MRAWFFQSDQPTNHGQLRMPNIQKICIVGLRPAGETSIVATAKCVNDTFQKSSCAAFTKPCTITSRVNRALLTKGLQYPWTKLFAKVCYRIHISEPKYFMQIHQFRNQETPVLSYRSDPQRRTKSCENLAILATGLVCDSSIKYALTRHLSAQETHVPKTGK